MTQALCLNCGAIKFGAFNPCPECKASSTGNQDLDIAFSDHFLSESTLKDFGSVIRQIREVCDDGKVRFWAFITYVSENHPTILTADVAPEMATRVHEVLDRLELPKITIQETERVHRSMPPKGNEGQKKWWQFWRQEE
jgi:hypothetical protein